MAASVLLIDPKYDFNVGGALRACAVLGASTLVWTGSRVPDGGGRKWRLPREERLADYAHVTRGVVDLGYMERSWERGYTPVAVERRAMATRLPDFEHPGKALYVFGPEDGTLGRGVLEACHLYVVIPSSIRTPLNLAAAVNVVLYDRMAKEQA